MWHATFVVFAAGLFFFALWRLGSALSPVIAGLIGAYLLDPIVDYAEQRWRWSRWTTTVVLFTLSSIVIVLTMLLLIPFVLHEISDFVTNLPKYLQQIRETAVPRLEESLGIKLPATWHEAWSQLGLDMRSFASKLSAPAQTLASTLALTTAGILAKILTVLLIPVFTFYFLPNFPKIARRTQALIPRRYVEIVSKTAMEIDQVLSAWIRGQLTVMTILATIYSIGLLVAGVKLGVFIGLLTGLLSFIPYVGVGVGAVLTLIMCLLEYQGYGPLVGALIVFGVAQLLEGFLLTPYLVGDKVGLGPVGVLIALMLGGAAFGFVGILLAVPTSAVLVVILRQVLTVYRQTNFYNEQA